MNTPYDIDFYRLIRAGSERSAAIVVPLVMRMISPTSVVDVGCGTGAWLSEFERAGVPEVLGLEFSEISADVSHIDRSKMLVVDASKSFQLNREFDLAITLEVAEHLPEESAATFVHSITRLAPIVMFSAAVPNQGGVNHINEQWPSYWARHFAEQGFIASDCLRDKVWLDDRLEWWYRQNLLFFVRGDAIHRYPELFAGSKAEVAIDRVLPKKMRLATTQSRCTSPKISTVVLTKDGSKRGLERCLRSIVESRFADELVVCIDRTTTDESAQIAKKYTDLIHFVETAGYVEDVLQDMMSRCSGDFILRLDDDECLGGDWNREFVEHLITGNDITHFLVPRCWLVPPGDHFISSPPWWPNLALRLFKNDASLITWPDKIHDQMALAGAGLVLSDCWIVHYDLLISSRPDRERKCHRYRELRPELHLSNFYLYEDEDFEISPAQKELILSRMQILQSQPEYKKVSPVLYYEFGTDIRFNTAGNSTDYTTDGWSVPEDWGRWTSGTRAVVRLRLQKPITVPAQLVADVRAFITAKHPTMRVLVTCQDQFVGEWSFTSAQRAERAVSLPLSLLQGQKDLTFTFFIISPMSPAQCGESDDARLLGLGFTTMNMGPELDTVAYDSRKKSVVGGTERLQDQNGKSPQQRHTSTLQEISMISPLVDVKELIRKYSVEELNQAAEQYWERLRDSPEVQANPYRLTEVQHLLVQIAHLIGGLKLYPGLTVLDFGAGTCYASRILNQLGMRVISCDVSRNALEIGERLSQQYPPVGTQPEQIFLHFDGKTFDLPDQSVDRIFCLDAFHHVPNQADILQEMARVLKDGGIAGFSEPGPTHSLHPVSQLEMRSYTVIENDIVLSEIFENGKRFGFTAMTIAVAPIHPVQVPLADLENFFVNPAGFLAGVKDRVLNYPIFFLYKGSPVVMDSRDGTDLVTTLKVSVSEIVANSRTPISLELEATNCSSKIWPASGSEFGCVNIGAFLHKVEPSDTPGATREFRFSLSTTDVHPGQTVSTTLRLEPLEPGEYSLEIDLVSEHVCWFEANCNSRLTVPLRISEEQFPSMQSRNTARETAGFRNQIDHTETDRSLDPPRQVTELVPSKPSQAHELERLYQEIAALKALLAEKDLVISKILRSTSWKLSKPIRLVGEFLRKMRK